MLKGFRLHNFKSAKNLNLKIAPLTVLAGLNGSGKSSVLQALALIRQSISLYPKANRLLLRGPLVDLGLSDDVHFEGAEDDILSIGFDFHDSDVNFLAIVDPSLDVLGMQYMAESDNQIDLVKDLFEGFQFIQADRLTPSPRYVQANTEDRETGWLGCHGEYTVDFLQAHGDDKVSSARIYPIDRPSASLELAKQAAPTETLLDQAAGWLQQLSPGIRLRALAVELADTNSLRFEYTGTGIDSISKQHRPVNVGFGLTYCLPIIIACLSAKKGSLLLLENPEAHLHPRGQSALGLLLALCANDGVQIIVETHSDHVINGIRVAAKQKRIDNDSVAFHYFYRDVEDGHTNSSSPVLLANGRFDHWPDGFFDEWGKALDELLEE